ncbi:DNA helicase IV [Pseudonocardia hierapolitana]|uniref:DNA helicase IV n=1 Tax=Pseudonocardia hierapolitana TaxID=1128676 RepID=A0A561SLY5_9PSEU|nr:ATP-binding domain-containing protein [Pseudonocardia hierapolitana]TWF75880.1 DNA helicase IV [Pseudonocardia hierapolitana]
MSSVDEDRRHIALLYDRFDAERAAAERELLTAQRASGSSPGERALRETAVRVQTARLGRLRAGGDGLCFGRTDAVDGTRTFVGRLGLLDDDLEPLLIDWRAPAARPFYTATAAHPEGLVRRRHFRTRGRAVLDAHDDVFVHGGDDGSAGSDAALLAALDAPRTGAMRDIVATIQAEQDEIIRLEHTGITVIEGGPGTGKTAVALHRVAYLLYTHPQLARRGVLVLGPHPRFLQYISAVLPSLGETDVVFATPGDLLPGLTTDVEDAPDAARVKGSLAMVEVIAAAVARREEVPGEPIPIELDDVTVEITAEIATAARERARARGLRHNEARPVFATAVLDALAEQAVDRIGAGWLAPREAPELAADLRTDARAELRENRQLHAALDALWPELTPQTLLADLFSSPERLDSAAAALAPADRAALAREDGAAWTVSDVPLLDEAAELLGPPATVRAGAKRAARRAAEGLGYAADVLRLLDVEPADDDEIRAVDLVDADLLAERHEELDHRTIAERAAADREWVYGHVVVDEAQELSDMDWRVLLRRCPTRSFTVVGDLAQRRSVAGARSWAAALERYAPGRWTHRVLTVGYRTPAEIMAVATDVLAAHNPGCTTPEAARSTGVRPWAQRVRPDELVEAVRDEVGGPGSVAVIAPEPFPEVPGATVLTPREAKGLEFDAVLLVEPQRMHPADLYVALTRATQRLGVLHTEPLPAGLHRLAVRV